MNLGLIFEGNDLGSIKFMASENQVKRLDFDGRKYFVYVNLITKEMPLV